jgi:hypothetical protein
MLKFKDIYHVNKQRSVTLSWFTSTSDTTFHVTNIQASLRVKVT